MIKNDNYEINIIEEFIHLINYKLIKNISTSRIEILIKEKKLIIKGCNLIINSLDEYEMIIKGDIKGLEFINE